MKACPPWLYHIRVQPKASLEAETSPCLADWKIAPEGWLALSVSTGCQYLEDTRLDRLWLCLPRPLEVPPGPQPLSAARGSEDTRPS